MQKNILHTCTLPLDKAATAAAAVDAAAATATALQRRQHYNNSVSC